ncbi:RTA1 domain-containing protein [Colletotrichum higginsianum IMI 349063]|uniref:RTA1 domain-containing protein n=1 Tax=Colletotrichum higginsianum (strain IMI 349063) TaxID=759273 RepID=A0A1B7XZN5_COLHI|nr:RTA1 domain-containing protein [Colletotrichum higginsianum IMI 349063]OBR05228.1 RTA1 domain-containing protein [Colletotrichum higginsianum IMI 349063]
MTDGSYVDGSYFFYAPNKGAPFFFAIAFAVSGVLHFWQCYCCPDSHYRFFKITGLFSFCCLLFTVGFAVRIYGAWNYDNLDTFIATVCLVYAAPPLLELANYHILGRVLYYVPYCSPLHPGRVLSTFAFFSGIVEALNGWGASYSANQSLSPREMSTGHALIKASLLLQVFVIACFVVLAVTFQRRCVHAGVAGRRGVREPLVTLYVSIVLILARTMFRIVEYFGVAEMRWGPDVDVAEVPAVIRHEWFFYVFEASLMLANVVMFNVRHPRRYLPEKYTVYLAKDGVTEVDGPGWKDPRPFWVTVVDPFDLVGVAQGRDRRLDRFWEGEHVSETGSSETRTGNKGTGAV